MADELPRRIEKPWGFELLLAHTPRYAGKLIFVSKGHRLSLQYHKEKDETIYLYQGEARIEIGEGGGELKSFVAKAGYCLHVPPLTRHRIQAIEDTTFFEVSTPELEDVVRVSDDYGRVS